MPPHRPFCQQERGGGVRILITKKTMTEESSDALSADRGGKQLPKGIHIVEADPLIASKEKVVPRRPLAETWGSTSEKPTSWSYLYLRHFAVKTFKKWLEHYNEQTEGRPQPFFIHQSYHYEYKNPEKQRGVRKVLQPSISGLVFLQGTVRDLQAFLDEHFPQFHLVNDRSRGCPASIEDAIMRPFMSVSRIHPERLPSCANPWRSLPRTTSGSASSPAPSRATRATSSASSATVSSSSILAVVRWLSAVYTTRTSKWWRSRGGLLL